MKGASVCSGIGGAEVAAPWIDWQFACEKAKFPREVLERRIGVEHRAGPGLVWTLLEDMTDWEGWRYETEIFKLDILCGGTPCQSFSVAGTGGGVADPRGNLSLLFPRIARECGASWIVWENVPGVLASGGGRDFAAFLGEVEKCGYRWAYRTLDAHLVRSRRFPRAIPQRRRRVYLVGHSGNRHDPATILFEREGLPGLPPPGAQEGDLDPFGPRGDAGEGGASYALHGGDSGSSVGFGNLISHCVSGGDCSPDVGKDDLIPASLPTLSGKGRNVAQFGRTDRLIPSYTLRAGSGGGNAMNIHNDNIIGGGTLARTLNRKGDRQDASVDTFIADSALRRLTPLEWERLMGFPDGWTDIRPGGTPDAPRYEALGNSWAVNCAEWVLDRIGLVEGFH